MIRSILVPMDCSAFGEQAVPVALTLAGPAKAKIHLLHVHRPLAEVHPEFAPYFDDEKLAGEIKTRQREYLDKVAARIAKQGIEVDCVVKEGATAATIHEYVKTHAVDLMVMTTHGRGAMARFWLGSVADELVRDLPTPILLVRPHGHDNQEAAPSLKRILVALDGSKFAEQVLDSALELAQLVEGEIVLLRVIKPFVPSNYSMEGVGHLAANLVEQLGQMEKQARQEAEQYLEHLSDRCRAKMVKATKQVVLADEPASAILEKATPPAIDMVALATHGRRGLSRLFLGSIADKVVRGSTVPVLVHRPRD
ncbi:MAG: universal stress protein [Gemmataceae bacterium]